MAREQDLGRGQAGRRRGNATPGGATAVFQVDDTSLRKLNDLWGQLVKNVKDFNAELKKIDGRKLDALGRSTGRAVGATGSGGRTSTIDSGGFSNPPGAGYPGPLHPGYGGAGGAGSGGLGQGAAGAGGQPHQRTMRQFLREEVTPARVGFGTVAAIAAYGGSHKQNMIDAERIAQYSSWSMSGRSEQANANIRDFWFGNQGKGMPGLTGGQNTGDYLRGISMMQGTLGYGMSRANQLQYQYAGQTGNLLGSYEQGARVQAGLQSTGSYYNLMSQGINTYNASTADIANQFMSRVYQGRTPTLKELEIGQRQGMSLQASMAAYGLDAETQEAVVKYGMTRAKLGEVTGLTGADLEKRMRDEMTVTGGKSKEGKSVFGATAFDAQRSLSQRATEAEQRIADTALPAMRESFEGMTKLMDTRVIPILESFAGTLAGVVAGGGAALGGPAAAVGSFAGGIIPSMLTYALLSRRLPPTPGPGPGPGPRGGLGGFLGRAGGRLGTAGRYGLAGGAGYLAGGMASDAVGGGYLGAGLQGGLTGAGIGAMAGAPLGPVGMAVGGAAGAVIGGTAGLAIHGIGGLFDRGGNQDGGIYGSREESEAVASALSSTATHGGVIGGTPGSPESSSTASPSGTDGSVTGGATRRGAAALAWMRRQSQHSNTDWTNYCLRAVRMSFGVAGGVKNATTAWYNTKKRHRGTPPPGVPVWWTGGDGHVALSAGGGYVWSTDILRKGKIDKVPIAMINRRWSGKPYQGWSEDINGVDVYDPAGKAGSKQGSAATANVGKPGAGVQRWASEVSEVLAELGMPADWQDEVLHRMNQESSGDHDVVNKWDSNWKRGTPSVGLMQVIGPTFRAYAGKYRNTGPFLYGSSVNPKANIYAGLNYASKRYGRANVPRVMMRPGGYASGAWEVQGDQLALIHHGEMVLPAQDARRVRNNVQRRREPRGGSGEARSIQITLNMPIHVAAGTTTADARRLVDGVVRELEANDRLAAVMAGD